MSPTVKEIELTILSRSRAIEQQIALLRAEQKGLEIALEVVLGHTEIVEDRICDPLGRRKADGDMGLTVKHGRSPRGQSPQTKEPNK